MRLLAGVAQTATLRGVVDQTGLQPGSRTLHVSAPGLALPEPATLDLKTGVQILNLELKLATVSDDLTLDGNSAAGYAGCMKN